MFEFDLDSFFNRVSRDHINVLLKEYEVPEYVRMFIAQCNNAVPVVLPKDIRIPEVEIKRGLVIKPLGLRSGPVKTFESVYKDGLPQGLPWSPLLAILLFDYMLKSTKLDYVTFADDGVIMMENKFEIRKLYKSIPAFKEVGIFFSIKPKGDGVATGFVKHTLNFLGLSWNWKRDVIKVVDGDREEWVSRSAIEKKEVYISPETGS
jgi:hypothetical protein